ncbi:hypothetical protein LEP1GSC062_2228 [Leptospira alexanderi serovar Manhao 3 str. L 60]|uniref:Uncharacterized protein n=1 Tax=Leptospira alexanderi serovar Manhao 3 str. L 60 TaxID=1049759 RepID=V6I4K8_9LEPT|nr:hypothetical protein LEP1GSC062_2228 [Leptospira alexanderi serovar Manhao 3 str. L 60]
MKKAFKICKLIKRDVICENYYFFKILERSVTKFVDSFWNFIDRL